jgi:ABC-2 type transport system ATP-binding protein
MQSAISLQNVTRHFGSLAAVADLSLNVHSGEVFGLLGPNGAGKTTTLNLIVGLLKPDQGEIRVLDYNPQTQARQVRRRVGLAPQETNVYLGLSALDNLRHHAALFCDDLSDLDQKIEDQLRRMDLWERRGDPVGTYSGGMKRRLALARALLHDPQIIFFDEPTLGVDVQGRHVLWEHIRLQCDLGRTFVVSTNDMNEADRLCDRLAIIDHGRVVALDTPEALKAALGRDIVTLRTQPAIAEPMQLFSEMDVAAFMRPAADVLRLEVNGAESKAGELVNRVTRAHRLESIRIARPSLDDVFLHYTGRALRE